MSLVMRVYLGMGAMIALVLTLGGFAMLQTNNLAGTFLEYRGTAKKSLLSDEMVENLLEARLAASKYRLAPGGEALASVSEYTADIIEAVPDLHAMMAGYPEQAALDPIRDGMQAYGAAMLAAHELQQRRDDLVAQTTETGLKARQQLSEVLETAAGASGAGSTAGLAISDLLLARLYLERFLVSNDPADAAFAHEEVEKARVGLADLLEQVQTPRHRELTEATMADLDAFDAALLEVSAVIRDRNAHYARMDEIGPEALRGIAAVQQAVVDRQNTLGPAGAAKAERAIGIMTVLVAIGTIVGAALAFFTARIIARSLARVTSDMGALADGKLDIDIAPGEAKTEIGKMTNAMVVFLDNARKARDLDLEVKENEKAARRMEEAERAREARLEQDRRAAEDRDRDLERARLKTLQDFQREMESVLGKAAAGDFSNRMSGAVDEPGLAALATVINELLHATESNIDDIVQSIGALSQGNLGIRIAGDRQGAFRRMQDDFNAALTTLSDTMAGILESSAQVAGDSAHLKTSASEMARLAEQNAATVEETSAAVEEITASIMQVVKNAQTANEATQKVRDSASRTREVSNRTEASIQEMTRASEQINNVVKVIEDIAFQINLLALNAGVEAARAGEAGRGFSVVASEVRALAQRSQEAVQEISIVIDRNNHSVEVGVQQVALSRDALEGIIADVEVASRQIAEITLAVEQQSTAIDEVNGAIRSIDATAQTNAASLEEMTAASVSVSGEADALTRSLGVFRGVPRSGSREPAGTAATTPKPGAPSERRPRIVAVAGGADIESGWEEF